MVNNWSIVDLPGLNPRSSAGILPAPGALLFLNAFSEIFISSNVGTSEDAVSSLSSLVR
jgi:hypothetical protein